MTQTFLLSFSFDAYYIIILGKVLLDTGAT
jgi:hypothetical protein